MAFVVLYNLNNINITERKRELATLKVLGFYDKEVSSYVYRENILLTLIGALAGLLIGKICTALLLRQWRLIRLCLDEISIHQVSCMPFF